MIARNYFEHNSPEVERRSIECAARVFVCSGRRKPGLAGTTGTLDEVQVVESQHVDLFVDTGIHDRGHRTTMLDAGFREVGIGIIRGAFTDSGTTYDSIMQTQDYATSPVDSPFVLGVVYNDVNHNNQYDYGEGTANSTVSLENVVKTTNDGGGYAFQVLQAGTYTLRFVTGHTQLITIGMGGPNIKVDLVNGTTVVINLGLGPLR